MWPQPILKHPHDIVFNSSWVFTHGCLGSQYWNWSHLLLWMLPFWQFLHVPAQASLQAAALPSGAHSPSNSPAVSGSEDSPLLPLSSSSNVHPRRDLSPVDYTFTEWKSILKTTTVSHAFKNMSWTSSWPLCFLCLHSCSQRSSETQPGISCIECNSLRWHHWPPMAFATLRIKPKFLILVIRTQVPALDSLPFGSRLILVFFLLPHLGPATQIFFSFPLACQSCLHPRTLHCILCLPWKHFPLDICMIALL